MLSLLEGEYNSVIFDEMHESDLNLQLIDTEIHHKLTFSRNALI